MNVDVLGATWGKYLVLLHKEIRSRKIKSRKISLPLKPKHHSRRNQLRN